MGKRKQNTSKSASKEAGTRSNDSLNTIKRVSVADDQRLLWGPYLSEREWGTVREDTSLDGNCWESFSHEEAVYRHYTSGEDGLLGICDDQATLCLSLALWNGKDKILKERLYGVTGPQGNHGEDVKECYFYLDSLPCHSYMRALYKYPQQEFPYSELLAESQSRDATQPEFELLDTGVFDEGWYWDVYAEYAKRTSTDLLCEYTLYNRGDSEKEVHVIPQLYFRNTWSAEGAETRPCKIQRLGEGVICSHPKLGKYIFEFSREGDPSLLYTENETNPLKCKPSANEGAGGKEAGAGGKAGLKSPSASGLKDRKRKASSQVLAGKKDAFHEYVVNGDISALNAKSQGTKIGVHYQVKVPAGRHVKIRCRLVAESEATPLGFGPEFDAVMEAQRRQADLFYKQVLPQGLTEEQQSVARQAYAGLCWNKQFFCFNLNKWLNSGTKRVVNQDWGHMLNSDVISMPDKWEFPWYATWDLAFHMVPMADIDPVFVKQQLLLLLGPRYMHPRGQLPAYEFDFSDVNPPVHAMAVLHVYRKQDGAQRDRDFLLRCFNKLTINFNWWLNAKQLGGSYLFGGGFLGMDNVSCLHRSQLPEGCTLYQVDGTCWMAYFSLCLLKMALELCVEEPGYVDMALNYLDHFLHTAHALNFALDGNGLWDAKDGFYYDRLAVEGEPGLKTLRVRAMIGLTALFPVYTLPASLLNDVTGLRQGVVDLLKLREPIVTKMGFELQEDGLFLSMFPRTSLLPAVSPRLKGLLRYLGDEREFLSPGGIRALSRYHLEHPFSVVVGGKTHTVSYNAGESQSDMFGGNSNWRGPVWFPMNYLLIEGMESLHRHVTSRHVRCAVTFTRQGVTCSADLGELSRELCGRLVALFLPDERGRRPCHGSQIVYGLDPHWRDLVLFYEYFDGDTGRGCGASHQTGWTALVTTLLRKLADH